VSQSRPFAPRAASSMLAYAMWYAPKPKSLLSAAYYDTETFPVLSAPCCYS